LRRYFRACTKAAANAATEPYTGNDPVGFVQSSCVHRSLNATQRALIAAGFLEYEREQAKRRQIELGKTHGQTLRTNLSEGVEPGRARDKAGARMGVSGQTVHAASKVIEKAVPEIIEKCKSGEMALNEAKRVIDLNPAAQRRIAELPKGQRVQEIGTTHVRRLATVRRGASHG